MKCNLMERLWKIKDLMERCWSTPDQVSDPLMVTRRLWPQRLAQRKQSWHLDCQFLRTRMFSDVFRACTEVWFNFTWIPHQHVYIYNYIYIYIYVYECICHCYGNVCVWWMGNSLEAEAIRLSMETAPEVLWQSRDDGKMGTDGFVQAMCSKFYGFYCFACLTGMFDDVRIWYDLVPFTFWAFVLESNCST